MGRFVCACLQVLPPEISGGRYPDASLTPEQQQQAAVAVAVGDGAAVNGAAAAALRRRGYASLLALACTRPQQAARIFDILLEEEVEGAGGDEGRRQA